MGYIVTRFGNRVESATKKAPTLTKDYAIDYVASYPKARKIVSGNNGWGNIMEGKLADARMIRDEILGACLSCESGEGLI